ncbi:hypothetical protein [Sorangium sp. So ce1389]|uniref:hypothetical protein n=1 Tax=Sorangium sp. So ce1389 TaxID=3133336 RepID=UPI003F5DA4BE
MKAKVQARSGKKAAAKLAADGAPERTKSHAAEAAREERGASASSTGGGAATRPRDAAAKPRDAAAKPRDAAAKPRDAATGSRSAAARTRDAAAAAPGDAAPRSARRGQDQATADEPAKKPGLLRRLLNLFRRSG